MKRNFKICLILLIVTQVTLFSCNKWLDVKPEDKTLESDIFVNEIGINKALNAVYGSLADKDLYGQNLTKSTIDVLAQYYNSTAKTVSGSNRYAEVISYNYGASESQAYFEQIWTSSYKTILSINNLLEGLEKYNPSISTEKLNIIKGEAYGLRAMLHFDLLRLFGPVYQSNPNSLAIPYKTSTNVALSELLPASQVISNVLADLNTASEYLEQDPIISSGTLENTTSSDNFYMNRNRRMNYYAVAGLMARVHMYANDKTNAIKYAEIVVNQASKWFPWQGEQEHLGINGNKIFSSEVIFGVNDVQMYSSYNELFNSSLNDNLLLAPAKTPNVSLDIYENNAQDFRYIANWEELSASQSAIRPFGKLMVKYRDTDSRENSWRNFQPLLRLSEMYYILSEAKDDVSYLNKVRSYRGLEALSTSVALSNELLKEYRKEFLGEGQLFFYYKRTNQSTIKGYNLSNVAMNETKYVVPLPLAETNQR